MLPHVSIFQDRLSRLITEGTTINHLFTPLYHLQLTYCHPGEVSDRATKTDLPFLSITICRKLKERKTKSISN